MDPRATLAASTALFQCSVISCVATLEGHFFDKSFSKLSDICLNILQPRWWACFNRRYSLVCWVRNRRKKCYVRLRLHTYESVWQSPRCLFHLYIRFNVILGSSLYHSTLCKTPCLTFESLLVLRPLPFACRTQSVRNVGKLALEFVDKVSL